MRRIILAVAATAAVTLPAAPASAGPPTLDDLRKGLLTEAEAPAGWHSLGEPSNERLPIPRNRSLCEDDQPAGEESATTAAIGYFSEDDGTSLAMGVAAPGASNALAFIQALEKTITRCPSQGSGDDLTTITRLEVPAFGDAATGVRVEETGDGDQDRDLTVAVTDGDVLVVFEMIDGDRADETDFLAFVDAGMLKLAEAGGGQFSAA